MSEEQGTKPENIQAPLNLLKLLCIISFLGSGMAFISFSLIGLFYQFFISNINLIDDNQTAELAKILLANPREFFLMHSGLYFISFLGVIFMWKLRKIGFHFYTLSQILILIVPYLFNSNTPTTAFSIFITLIFIVSYSIFLKQMK